MASHDAEGKIGRRTALQTIGASGLSALGFARLGSAQAASVLTPPQRGLKGVIVTGYGNSLPFTITVSGRAQPGPRAEPPQATISRKQITGSVGNYSDSYLYSGDMTSITIPDKLTVSINRSKDTITVNPVGYTQSDPLIYSLSVSGRFTDSTSTSANLAAGGSTEDIRSGGGITDDIAYGEPVEFRFTGEFKGLSIEDGFQLKLNERVPVHTDFNPNDEDQMVAFIREVGSIDNREPFAAEVFESLSQTQLNEYLEATTPATSNVTLVAEEDLPADTVSSSTAPPVYYSGGGTSGQLRQQGTRYRLTRKVFRHTKRTPIGVRVFTHHHKMAWKYNGRRIQSGSGAANSWGTDPWYNSWEYRGRRDHSKTLRRLSFTSYERSKFVSYVPAARIRLRVSTPFTTLRGGINGGYRVVRKGF